MLYYLLLIILSQNGILSSACEIYLLGQCPLPTSSISDLDDYCMQVKLYVSCFNKKLKHCNKKPEFNSAIETVKLNLKALVNQVNNELIIKKK